MTPAAAFTGVGEAFAATTSALEGSAATAAANRVSESLALEASGGDAAGSTAGDAAGGAAGDAADNAAESTADSVAGGAAAAASATPPITSSTFSIEGAEFSFGALTYRALGGGSSAVELVGFAGEAVAGELAVPSTVFNNGEEVPVTGIAFAGGQRAEGVTALALGKFVESVDAASVAAALPNLECVTVDAEAAAVSASDGLLYKKQTVRDGAAWKTIEHAELVLVPAKPGRVVTVAGDCTRVNAAAFAGAADVETIVAAGAVEIAGADGADGAGFSEQQRANARVVTAPGREGAWRDAGFANVSALPAAGATATADGLVYTMMMDGRLAVAAADAAAVPADLELPRFGEIDGVAYAVGAVNKEGFKGAPALVSVAVPEGVTDVMDAAFEGCASLSAVALPYTL